ncbi:MAG: HAMP domain-containing histidine kinase [Thermoguttaceae bacterium]|nr:HAMP domain-containing histidine kinase [Thermoguttaceae bacterium]MDW8038342.1 HAMP domain-containing sensor histidine kinase [Thermoguttaceae bacterium]
MVGLVAAWCWWRNLLQEQRFFQYLEQLADWAQESTFATDCVLEKQSLLSNRWTFFPVVARLKEAIGRLRGRLEHLEDVRAGLEVRMRRVQSEGQQIYTILTGIPEPLLAINEYGELLWANPSAEALLQGEASGKRALVAERIGCPQLVALLQHMLLRKTATSRSEEIEWIDPQGKTHFYRVMVTRLAAGRDPPDPGQVSLIAVFRDIADQKALQKRHAEFVSSVSHEMKTPLAGIKAYVELLADGDVDDPATQQEFFQTIAAQVDRLQRLVENLLNLARIEAGIVEVRKHPHSLNEILEEAFRVVQPAAQAKQIRLETDLSELYLNVYIDRDLLLQAAINLLSNAVKYTPSGGRVVLRSRLEEPYAQFEVEDTGVGLSPEDCQRVFEKFYRVQKDAHMASGTGLGLPLAKHIVEDVHGGTITVQSQLGVGSTFRVRLPLLGRTWDSRGPVSEMSEPASVGAPG